MQSGPVVIGGYKGSLQSNFFAFMLLLCEYIRQILVFLIGEEMGENSNFLQKYKIPLGRYKM